MADKRKRGLGKGLDALIPISESNNENTKSNILQEEISPSKENKQENNQYIEYVKLSKVEPNKNQPRKNFDKEKLQELADSIKSKGLLEPIIVEDKDDHYEIIAGERRWRACKLAEIKEIPVIVKNYDNLEKIEVSLIENIQREDLNPIEEAKAYKTLIEEYNLNQEEVAAKVSKNRVSIANSIRLLKLTEPVQNMVIEGQLSMGQARALIPIDDEKIQEELALKIIKENLSVRETEKLIRNLSESKKQENKKEKTDKNDLSVIYNDIATKMNTTLGMKVKIKTQSENSGKIEITFTNEQDLEKLMELLIK